MPAVGTVLRNRSVKGHVPCPVLLPENAHLEDIPDLKPCVMQPGCNTRGLLLHRLQKYADKTIHPIIAVIINVLVTHLQVQPAALLSAASAGPLRARREISHSVNKIGAKSIKCTHFSFTPLKRGLWKTLERCRCVLDCSFVTKQPKM